MERGSSGGCRGGESDRGGVTPSSCCACTEEEGGLRAGLDAGGCRWAEAGLPPPSDFFFPFPFFCRKEKREKKDRNFGVFISEIFLLNYKAARLKCVTLCFKISNCKKLFEFVI